MTPRERVYATLNFNLPVGERPPRQMWILPWALENFPGAYEQFQKEFPDDILHCPGHFTVPTEHLTEGNAYQIGTYEDEWNCVFKNFQSGVIGEVKEPLVDDWDDTSKVHFPVELLNLDVEKINKFCRGTDRFVLAGACPRIFERLQFIRGTEDLLVDLAMEEEGLYAFIEKMHQFYLKELGAWSKTEVDALMFMDDWGTQNSLLINPVMWREIFKPLYKEYIDLAHAAGKKIFMHSDGNILSIYPDLVELGLDAINSQVFCMGLDQLAPHTGKITFWGEMDRQHILPNGTAEEVKDAVHQVFDTLSTSGGVIAQCEFGPGANPENVRAVYEAWNEVASYA